MKRDKSKEQNRKLSKKQTVKSTTVAQPHLPQDRTKHENRVDKSRNTKKRQESRKQKQPKSKKMKIFDACLIIALVIGLIFLGVAVYNLLQRMTFTEEIDEIEIVDNTTEYIDDNSLELGTENVEQTGAKGKRRSYYKVTKSLLQKETLDKEFIRSETLEEPVNAVIRRGTRKWQYMYCSDGSARYFNDEQFTNPNVGFTHASEDFCAKNGQGTMVALGDTPPAQQTLQQLPTSSYFTIPDYDYSYTPPTNSYSTDENEDVSDSNNEATKEAEELANQRKYLSAKYYCQDQAARAYQSVMRQLGAMGASGSNEYFAKEAMDSTYNSCMRQEGY